MTTPLDVLVIGAGQAGLAAGYQLRASGLRFVIIDALPRVGDNWRRRYDSLTLFTPRRFSELPGLALGGDPEGYPSKDEFADYLETYAKTFDLPIRSGARVRLLTRVGARFVVELEGGERLEADKVIVASGAFQVPAVPAIATAFSSNVLQLTVAQYQRPSDLPPGAVLVVGDGASGRDIAAELAPTRTTYLASGRARRLLPERVFGQSIWSWLDRLGLMRAGPNSLIGRTMRRADPFPDRNRNNEALSQLGVSFTGRLAGADSNRARFVDGSQREVATVVWATGYRDDNGWIDVPGARDAHGNIIERAGASPVPGLFFLGRPWQRNRASALIMGAGDDARVVVATLLSGSSTIKAADGHTTLMSP